MHPTIAQRLGERLIHKKQSYNSKQNMKSINEELLQMVANIRSLEDQLLAQQYRQDLLLGQNQLYNSKLEKLNSRNTIQRQRIAKLEEEYQMYQVKNKQLQICQDSLKSIYEEIQSLTKIVESRAEECEVIKFDNRRISQENQTMREQNFELQQQHQHINNSIANVIKSFPNQKRKFQSEKPIVALKQLIQDLTEQLIGLESQNMRTQRQGGSALISEKQAIIKLQFQEQLLRQRAKDENKIEKLSEMYANQSNLEAVVQQMLIKQDQLLEHLRKLQTTYSKNQKNYHLKLEKLKNEQQDWRLKSKGYLNELSMQREHTKGEISQSKSRILTKTQRYQQIYEEQQISMRMDINLASLKRLRQVQERNKYLKLKIHEQKETKSLLLQQKQLLHSQ